MIPVLYEATETDFTSLGLGALADAIDTYSIEIRNTDFYLELEYPVDGVLFEELKTQRIIKAHASHALRNQRFEIIRVTKPSNGVVKVFADHISRRTAAMQLKPNVRFTGTAELALRTWKDSMVDEHEFTTYSDISTVGSGSWTIDKVDSARRALQGVAGSMLDVYGGEYRFDNTHISLLKERGVDDGALIAYGKNLTELEQEEEISSTFTSIYPYAIVREEGAEEDDPDAEETLITLPEYFLDSENIKNFAQRKIQLVDFSEEKIDNIEDLRRRAKSYLESNNYGVPKVNLTVKFVDLAKTLDYEHLKLIEEINLCDWVTVSFDKLGVRTKAKVIRTKWNVLLDRYEELEIGEARASFSQSVGANVEEQIKEVERRLNTFQLAADGKTVIYRGPDEPENGKENDVWYRPIGEGELEMYIHNGAIWEFQEMSAGSLAGTINFANLNTINLIADNISGGQLNLAKGLMITNNDDLVLYIDSESGEVVANFSRLQINFDDVATKEDLKELEMTPGEGGVSATLSRDMILFDETTPISERVVSIQIMKGDKDVTSEWQITVTPSESLTGYKSDLDSYTVLSLDGVQGLLTFSATKDGESLWKVLQVHRGKPGPGGKTAYEVAVEEGFEGTEKEWLESLRGDPGLVEDLGIANLFSIFHLEQNRYNLNSQSYVEQQLEPNTKYTISTNIPLLSGNDTFWLVNGRTQTGVSDGEPFTFETTDSGLIEYIFRMSTVEEVLDGGYQIKLEKGPEATGWIPNTNDLYEMINDKANSEVLAELNGNIEDLYSQLENRVTFSEYEQWIIDAEIRIRDAEKATEAAEVALRELTNRTAAMEINLGEQSVIWNFLSTSITQGDEGIFVAEKGSNTGILIGKNRIDFMSAGTSVAHVGSQELWFEHGIFAKSARIGTYKFENLPNSDILGVTYMERDERGGV